MNRRDLKIFISSAVANKGVVALHAATDITLIACSLGFSGLIALYFGHDVFGLSSRPLIGPFAAQPTIVLIGAAAFAVGSLVAKLMQSIIEAQTIANRERWFAEVIRATPSMQSIPSNVARASSYYGRMALSAMKATSSVVTLTVSLFTVILTVPKEYLSISLSSVLLVSLGLYFIMIRISIAMGRASNGLVDHARGMAQWKTNPYLPANEDVAAYYRSYFYRVFLASSFSFVGLSFAVVFCLLLLILREFTAVKINFGEVFIAFMVVQSYLGVFGKLLGALVHGSAFMPAVRPYFGVAGDDPPAAMPGAGLPEDEDF